jgi:hypothetical protein
MASVMPSEAVDVLVKSSHCFCRCARINPNNFVFNTNDGRFEKELAHFAVPDLSRFSRAEIKAHVWIANGFFYFVMGRGNPRT